MRVAEWVDSIDHLMEEDETMRIIEEMEGLPLRVMIELRSQFQRKIKEANKEKNGGAASFGAGCVACYAYWDQRIKEEYGLTNLRFC